MILPIRLGAIAKAFLIPTREGAILIDSGTPGQSERILQAMAAHGAAPESLRLILITHGHFDHFGSARELRERTGAPVAVHADDAIALRRGENPPA